MTKRPGRKLPGRFFAQFNLHLRQNDYRIFRATQHNGDRSPYPVSARSGQQGISKACRTEAGSCTESVYALSYSFLIKLFNFIKKTPPNGVVVSMIFGMENHGNPSHYDLHIENFNSCELKFSIEYQYQILPVHPSPSADGGVVLPVTPDRE